MFQSAVHAACYSKIAYVEFGLYPRPDRAKCVERFRTRKLPIFFLKIASCHVVKASVPLDILKRIFAVGEILTLASDNDSELALMCLSEDVLTQILVQDQAA